MLALQKRKEHNMDTWVLFIDLVKAFDSVSREALFDILRRFGFTDHFVNMLIRLHFDSKLNIKIGGVTQKFLVWLEFDRDHVKDQFYLFL
jgi:hypothetical protein